MTDVFFDDLIGLTDNLTEAVNEISQYLEESDYSSGENIFLIYFERKFKKNKKVKNPFRINDSYYYIKEFKSFFLKSDFILKNIVSKNNREPLGFSINMHSLLNNFLSINSNKLEDKDFWINLKNLITPELEIYFSRELLFLKEKIDFIDLLSLIEENICVIYHLDYRYFYQNKVIFNGPKFKSSFLRTISFHKLKKTSKFRELSIRSISSFYRFGNKNRSISFSIHF